MTKNQVDTILLKAQKIEPKKLMGTIAYHKLGEISRQIPDIFTAVAETETYWVGSWVTGFGFVSVLFPKETSRELTEEEVETYKTKKLGIGSYKLNIV